MLRHWEELARYEREGFDIVVEKSWEELHPRDCFDDTCYDIKDMCDRIDRGALDWFMLRVRVKLGARTLSKQYLGGLLYEDAREVLTDGVAEDMIWAAVEEARKEALVLHGLLGRLLAQRVEETV